jgi:phosphoribosylamine---glycine ligase
MKVLVLGSGGREHALAWKLSRSRRVEKVFVGPGNAGTSAVGVNIASVNPMDPESVLAGCRANGIDCVLVGPEAPLAAGIVDFLSGHGVPAIGPRKASAQLEASKAFSKAFLVRNGLPTARAEEFSDSAAFERYVRPLRGTRLVAKKSGLAAGKGVLESSDTEQIVAFGKSVLSSDKLLVEEFLEGWEVSVFGLSDGKDFIVLPPCTDFKKAGDGDTGPNTGGMGSICPVPKADAKLMEHVRRVIVEPTYAALSREGLSYAGILYFGLMITADGPKILEFNVRFGDPETQVLMPMLGHDLGHLVEAMAQGTLGRYEAPAERGPGAALGVVIASRGYPESSEKGAAVAPFDQPPENEALIFHASTVNDPGGTVRTGGGRCFAAVGLGSCLRAASENAYRAAARVRFDGGWHRSDIGKKFIEEES